MVRALLIVWLLVFAVAPQSAAARDHRVASDAHITALYALNHIVLYHIASPAPGRWIRVIYGKRFRARRVPRRAVDHAAAGSTGIDARGHVVVTLQARGRWWIYDVVRDTRRAVAVPARGGCTIDLLAIWRTRTAYVQECRSGLEVVVREGRRTRRFTEDLALYGLTALAQQGRSLATLGLNDEPTDAQAILNQGRRCPQDKVELPENDHTWHALEGVWIGPYGMEWVMGSQTDLWGSYPYHYANVAVMAVHLTGRCSVMTTRWHIPSGRFPTVTTVAIDGRDFYYATDDGVFLRRLPAHASAAPPVNDRIAHAIRLSSKLPLRMGGVVGNATRQPAEHAPSVWYAWQAPASQRVSIGIGQTDHWVDVFTGGPRVATLTPVSPVAYGCGANAFDVVAGRTYWISVAATTPEPSYEPFTLRIGRHLPPAC